jgi:hypothetical protein
MAFTERAASCACSDFPRRSRARAKHLSRREAVHAKPSIVESKQ